MAIVTTTSKITLVWPPINSLPESTAVIDNGILKEFLLTGKDNKILITSIPDIDELQRVKFIVGELINALIPPQNINNANPPNPAP